jgi:urate oxidase
VSIRLGANQYGKAETRLVRVRRDGDEHELTDLNVSVALAGDLDGTHLRGDNAGVLPTDTQKNTVYAFARDGVGEIEAFAQRLARHFVDSQPSIRRATVAVEQYGWRRLGPHSFERTGGEVRTARVRYDGSATETVSGLSGLVLLNTTGSEFHGFVKDRYTTLPETHDRILATAVTACWRHLGEAVDAFADVRGDLVSGFVETYSYALQQTLYAMGERVLRRRPGVAEVKLSMPNKHHFLVDLRPFGLDNPDEVYLAADRPYGLIEGVVVRDGVTPVWTF